MDIKTRIQMAILSAMKLNDSTRRTVLRMAKNNIDLKEKESKKILDDAGAEAILGTMIKQRKDSIDQFTKGNRLDLAEKEAEEIKILEEFMPQEVTKEEATRLVVKVCNSFPTQPLTMKDLGSIIKEVKACLSIVRLRVDGKLLSDVVREHLSK